MNESLKVEILEKYKKKMLERFDSKNMSKRKTIRRRCLLCRDFVYRGSCSRCPFTRYRFFTGCHFWMKKVLGRRPRFDAGISYVDLYQRGSITDLKKLRKKAKALITWV